MKHLAQFLIAIILIGIIWFILFPFKAISLVIHVGHPEGINESFFSKIVELAENITGNTFNN